MTVWDFYFASLVAWRLHPGYLREGAQAPSLEEIADMVDSMCEVRERRATQWLLQP